MPSAQQRKSHRRCGHTRSPACPCPSHPVRSPLLSHCSRPLPADVSAEIAAALASCTAWTRGSSSPFVAARPSVIFYTALEDFPYESAAPGVPAAVAYHVDLMQRLLVSHVSLLGPSAGCLPACAALPISILWRTEVTSPSSGLRAASDDQPTLWRLTNLSPYQRGWLV